MAVARGALQGTRAGLRVLTTTALHADAASGHRCYATHPKGSSSPPKDFMRRIRIASCRAWYYPDGAITTTADNQTFFRTHGIAIDNGKSYKLREPSDASKLLSKYGIRANFHEQHLVHPYQIEFLDPRGHPLAEQKRAEHLEKHQTQPLWTIITAMSAKDKAIVRTRAQRRLRASLWSGLERAGYNKYGKGNGTMIYGTVFLTVQEPLRYMNMISGEEVGDAMVKLLEAEMRRRRRKDQNASTTRGRARDYDRGQQTRQRNRGTGPIQKNDQMPSSSVWQTAVQLEETQRGPGQSRRRTDNTRRGEDSVKRKKDFEDAFEASFQSKR